MGGAAATLSAVADLAIPPCGPQFSIEPGAGSLYQPITTSCEARSEIARNMADGIIVVIVAAGVFAWHMRESRRELPAEASQQTPTEAGPPMPPPPAAG
jgi:hypothetical protein